MDYLVRFHERGREAQVRHRGTRRDLMRSIRRALPQARFRAYTGRLLVTSARPADAVLAGLHGVRSFSPCEICRLSELPAAVERFAHGPLAAAASFRVAVHRVGEHRFQSQELAARLGAVVRRRHPHLEVRLRDPDVSIGVEIRQRDCYLFHQVIDGADHRPLRRESTGPVRFLVDQMLGPLTAWLRILGFDTVYARDIPDCHVVRWALGEGRVIVTRDLELSETPAVRAVYLRRRRPADQLVELAEALALELRSEALFTRCSLCNGPVQPVAKAAVVDRLPPAARDDYDELTRCEPCDKIYWKGAQYQRIMSRLDGFVTG